MIVEPIILFNLSIALACVWTSMIVNSKFLRPAILNKNRFALYELRDQLALLAMRGELDEESEEYTTLIKLMNDLINSTKDFRITRFIQIQSAIFMNKQLRAHLESIIKKIESDKMPDSYRVIVSNFFGIAHEIYAHKTWMLINLLSPLIIVVTLVEYVIKNARKVRNFLVYQRDRINNIESELKENIAHFAL